MKLTLIVSIDEHRMLADLDEIKTLIEAAREFGTIVSATLTGIPNIINLED